MLDAVDVLVFVHVDIIVGLRDGAGDAVRAAVGIKQAIEFVLQIGIVADVPPLFFGLIAAVEFCGKAADGKRAFGRVLHAAAPFCRSEDEEGADPFFEQFLYGRAILAEAHKGGQILFFGAKGGRTAEQGVQRHAGLVIAARAGFLQVFQQGAVALPHPRHGGAVPVAFLLRFGGRGGKQGQSPPGRRRNAGGQIAAEGVFIDGQVGFGGHFAHDFGHLLRAARITAAGVEKVKQKPAQRLFFGAGGGQTFGQFAESVGRADLRRVPGIAVEDQLFAQIVQQQLLFGRVGDAHVGRDPGFGCMLAQKAEEKAVHRADLRRRQRHGLACQPSVVGTFGGGLRQRLGDMILEVGGGGAGEGDDQHPRDIRRVLRIQQGFDDTPGQCGSFARAGRGGDKKRFVSLVDGRLLGGCRFVCHIRTRRVAAFLSFIGFGS